MSTHDMIIDNAVGATVRADINNALGAIATNNSSATEPATMYAYQWWADTTTGFLKQRNAANSAWITIGTLASTYLGLASAAQIQSGALVEIAAALTGTEYAATPSPAIAAYAAGQRFMATFDLACPAAPTLALNGVASPPNLVRQNVGGTFSNLAVNAFPAGWVSPVKLVSTTQALVESLPERINQGTTTTTTSGTTADYTIPSGARRITVSFAGFSTNGTSNYLVQLGDSGGIEATGYLGASDSNGTLANFSTGFLITAGGANVVIHGSMTLTLLDAATNTWAAEYSIGRSDAAIVVTGGGSKPLSAELTTVRITTVNGTDAFDAGLVNVQWEF